MQHVERVPLPQRGVRTPSYAFLVIALLIIAVIAGALYLDRQAPEATVAASWANEELLATNPELKVVLQYRDAQAARTGLAFMEQNPELILMRGYEQAADEAFLATNPELKVQRRYLESTGN